MKLFLKKKFFFFFNLITFLFIFSFSLNSKELPDSFSDLVDKLIPAVVNISTTQTIENKYDNMPQLQFPPGSPFEDLFKDFFDRQSPHKRKATSLGSGFVIDESGYIVTNNHVIGNADEIEVIFQDGTKLNAELVDLFLMRGSPF